MKVKIVLISKLCSQILDIREVDIKFNLLNPIKDLEDLLDDTYGPLGQALKVWRYASNLYFEIKNYASYTASLLFGSERCIYVLIRDYEGAWIDNGKYIEAIDSYEDKLEKQMQRGFYDVLISNAEIRALEEDENLLEQSETCLATTTAYRTDADVISYAVRNLHESTYYTEDFTPQAELIETLKRVITASFLCLANFLGMKGEIITCPHEDIYFLESHTKSETTDLANMFSSPSMVKDVAKYKPSSKLKQKFNPALDFFIEDKTTTKTACRQGDTNIEASIKRDEKSKSSGPSFSGGLQSSSSRRNSIDLYEEAAAILGLTCSQTDDCRCIECQCHYFDFEEEMDFSTAGSGEYFVGHTSSCSIQ